MRRTGSASAAEKLRESASVFAALGEPTRLHLVARLSDEGPLSIAQLREGTDVTRQAITKHLRVMADAGLITGQRAGRESVWELEPRRLERARKLLDKISSDWDATLGRLKAFVEE